MPSTNGRGAGNSADAAERVALYMRVSSEEQREKESIETQDGFLEEYCKLYGHQVVGIYKDEAISGTVPMRERPEGRKLLEDAKAGAFDVILSYKLDRIGRSLLVVVDTHDRLQEAGVSLRSATEPIDTSTPAGRLIFQMLASFAEFERATIIERSRDGLQRAFKKGVQLGRIPYGYDISEEGAFVVVEKEARVVRQVIASIAGGATLYSEAKRLNNENEPSPGYKYRGRLRKHGPRWNHNSIRSLVRQRAYSGTHVVNAHNGPIERPVPAIVAEELHRRALEHLEENRRYSGGKPGRTYLLRGLIKCANCGTSYMGGFSSPSGTTKRYYKYHCHQKRTQMLDHRIKFPKCPAVKAEWLEGLVWEDVRTFLANPGDLLARVREQVAEDEDSSDLEERHASLTKRLAAQHSEKSRYVKLYGQGHIDEDELEVYLADLKNQTENLKLLIASVEGDLARKQEDTLTARSAEAWLLTLRKNLQNIERDDKQTIEERRELLKLLVDKIVVGMNEDGRTKVGITYRFGPPTAGLQAQAAADDSAVRVNNLPEL